MNFNHIKKGSKKKSTKDTINDILISLTDLNSKIESIDKNVVNSHNILSQQLDSSQIISDTKTEIEKFKEHIKQEIIKDLKNGIKKGHYIIQENIASNTTSTKELNNSILETKDFMENTLNYQLQDATQQFKELIVKRQEIKNLEKKIESLQDTAVEFFQYIERTIEIIGKSNDKDSLTTQLPVYKKVLKDFEKFVIPLKLQRICPKPNEKLDESFHEAVEEKESENIQSGQIIECQEWGYSINGELYKNRRAKVVLAKSPEQNQNVDQDSESKQEKIDQLKEKVNENILDQEPPTSVDNPDDSGAGLDSVSDVNDNLKTSPQGLETSCKSKKNSDPELLKSETISDAIDNVQDTESVSSDNKE